MILKRVVAVADTVNSWRFSDRAWVALMIITLLFGTAMVINTIRFGS